MVLIHDQYFHFLWTLQNKCYQTSETYHKEDVEQKWSYNLIHNVQWLPKNGKRISPSHFAFGFPKIQLLNLIKVKKCHKSAILQLTNHV